MIFPTHPFTQAVSLFTWYTQSIAFRFLFCPPPPQMKITHELVHYIKLLFLLLLKSTIEAGFIFLSLPCFLWIEVSFISGLHVVDSIYTSLVFFHITASQCFLLLKTISPLPSDLFFSFCGNSFEKKCILFP